MASRHDFAASGFGGRARYRVRQFRRGLSATLGSAVSAAEEEQVRSLLPAAALSLFAALPPDARRHSLAVLQSMAQRGPVQPDLAAAALLHDAGKVEAQRAGAPIGLWLRGPLVLGEALMPLRLAKTASSNPASGWRYTLWVHLHHAEIGAAWAQEAGCSARTVWLIAHHADSLDSLDLLGEATAGKGGAHSRAACPDATWLDDLRLLQWADGQN